MSIYNLIINDPEKVELANVFLTKENKIQIDNLIKEHQYIDELHKYGLPVNNKLLLQGSSGCGKTHTAKAIANALGKPILILNLSHIINARIGETSQNIKQVFDKAAREKAVLFLDEFDQIAKSRASDDKEVGEIRRIVNTLIQLIDYYPEKALLIAATNHPEIIDTAIIRRFQLSISYELPDRQFLNSYYDKILASFPESLNQIPRKYDISFAEAKDYTYTVIKGKLIAELDARKQSENESILSEALVVN